MKPIRTILIEDIPDNLLNLRNMLSRYCPQVEVIGDSDNVESSYDLIIHHRPDLVIFDIGLKEGLTSFDLLVRLKQVNAITFEVLFLTGEIRYEYATRAFEYSAIAFLNKPINPEKLSNAIEKAGQRLNRNQYQQQIELMLTLLQTTIPQDRDSGKMALHLAKGVIEFIEIKNLVRCEADGAVTWFYFSDNSRLAAMRNLGYYNELLVKDYNFFPVSQSEIINLSYVKRYNHADLEITLTNGTVRYASRRGGQELRQYLSSTSMSAILQPTNIQERFKRWLGLQ